MSMGKGNFRTFTFKTATFAIIPLLIALPLLVAVSLLAGGCGSAKTLVVYTAVDQVFSEPLFRQFSNQTGIRVLPVYDVEAAKTTGLVNRLIAEKSKPQADVFWSNEFIQTILLQEKGILAPYVSPSAKDIPASFKETSGYWTGFGGRARVLLVNKEMVSKDQYPSSLLSLMDSAVDPKLVGIALPMFGTTATHAAALYAELGRDKALAWFKNARDMGIQAVDGNSVVRDMVVSGQMAMGLTDTDDAYGAVNAGAPVDVVYLDQGEGEMGTLVNPNTVALIAGAPHATVGRQFVDWLLRPETEAILLESGWIDLPCRNVGLSSKHLGGRVVKGMSVNLADIYKSLEASKADMTELFVR
jgi:iron(III) transport system substrate-binding protein